MKYYFLLTGIILTSFSLVAQDPGAILKKSYEKCQSVQNGYYEMTRHMKYISNNDTVTSAIKGYFKKLPDDTLFMAALHFQQYFKNEFTGEILYTGADLVTANAKDSTATMMSKSLWAKEMKAIGRNQKFYSPLMSSKSAPLPNDSDTSGSTYLINYIGEESLDGIVCYHIQANEILDNDSTQMMKQLRNERHFWINTSDWIPIQYTIAYDMVMNNDTMHQFEKNTLTRYEINNLKDEGQFKPEAVPGFYKIKDYVPYTSPELLPTDTLAPNWELLSTRDQKISLSSHRGSLVLIDFFYKSCYPCMLALPGLQALHEKYKDKGFKVIGIDPFDKKEDGIVSFLEKRGVTYTVLLIVRMWHRSTGFRDTLPYFWLIKKVK